MDTHSVKTLLLDLPSIGYGASVVSSSSAAAAAAAATSSSSATVAAAHSRKAPASYTKIVVKGMTRVEMTLKVVMSSDMPTEQFVEQYVKLVPDADLAEFQKVLDMRGVRKVDQAPFVEHFRSGKISKSNFSPLNLNFFFCSYQDHRTSKCSFLFLHPPTPSILLLRHRDAKYQPRRGVQDQEAREPHQEKALR